MVRLGCIYVAIMCVGCIVQCSEVIQGSSPFKGTIAWMHPNISFISALSPDWKLLATPVGKEIWVIKTSNGQVIRRLIGSHTVVGMENPTLKFSRDGRFLSMTGYKVNRSKKVFDCIAIVWRISDGKRLWSVQYEEKDGWTADSCLLPRGALYTTWESHTWVVRLRLIANGRVKREMTLKRRLGGTTFSPDGKWLATGGKLWRLTGANLHSARTFPVDGTPVFSTNSKYLAIVQERTVIVYRINDGQMIGKMRLKSGKISKVLSISPDGQLAVTVWWQNPPDSPYTILLWRVKDGKVLRKFDIDTSLIKGSFSSDSRQVALWGNGNLYLWRIGDGQLITTLYGHPYFVNDVAFDPNKRFIATVSDNSVYIWEIPTGRLIKVLKGAVNELWRVAFSPDGRFIASGAAGDCGDDTISLWQVEGWIKQWQRINHHGSGSAVNIAFSPDIQLLASCGADGTIRLWRVKNGELLRIIKGKVIGTQKVRFNGEVREVKIREYFFSVTFSRDGKTLITGGSHGIQFWRVADGSLLKRWDVGKKVHSIALSHDGQQIAIGTEDGFIGLYSLSDGKCLWQRKANKGVISVTFLPNSEFLASSDGKIWRAKDGALIQQLPCPMGQGYRVAASPDGRALVACFSDGLILWR